MRKRCFLGVAGVFLFLALSGCAGTQASKGAGWTDPEKTLLDTDEAQQERLQKFYNTYAKPNEIQKIEYLLDAIERSDAVFIRNGEQYNSHQAAKWLAWKAQHPQYRDNPILTAWDFVTRVADGSKATGWPYEIVLSGGMRIECQKVLSNELRLLELKYKEAVVRAVIGPGAAEETTEEVSVVNVPETSEPQKDIPAVDMQ